MPLGVGLIGCGAIGTVLAHAIDEGQAGDACLAIVYDIKAERAEFLSRELKRKPKIAESFKEFVQCKGVELVVEAASQEAVRAYAAQVLKAEKDLMIMSVGALVDPKLASEICRVAKEKGRRVYIPSGAIAGLDGVKASSIGRVEKVTLITRKPLRSLEENSYFRERFGGKIEGPTLIYEGPAVEACKLFPANVNVAAALGLAGVGAEKTMVRIIADPSLDRNIHEIEVMGEFGELKVCVRNVPSASNPKTSYLAALSAIATLRKITEPLVVGT
ncbi:MAG: aspartate dehydrogenase [Nitrososphaerota archaeon]|nr:aspartate dehydrogenase [Candidatus Bathyarchaeota archaeon]MDW8023673.1 aspartate dehydrogenase [Nitrososphaerota archaeon]